MSELGKRLIKSGARNPHAKLSKPLWSGPDGEGPNGGITFSLLSRFLVCRERFRLHALEGWRTQDGFNHRLEYGNMWHGTKSWLTTVPICARNTDTLRSK
jgi:hypothetical protein